MMTDQQLKAQLYVQKIQLKKANTQIVILSMLLGLTVAALLYMVTIN